MGRFTWASRTILCAESTSISTRSCLAFSAKYDVDRLVWYEAYGDVTEAIRREKQIKKWKRDWKIALIEADNPDWSDLYDRIAV